MNENEPKNTSPEVIPTVDVAHTTARVLDAELDKWAEAFGEVPEKARMYLKAFTLITVLAGGVQETAQAEVPLREINQAHEIITSRRLERLQTDLKELKETLKQLESAKAEALKDQEKSLKIILSAEGTSLSQEQLSKIRNEYDAEILELNDTIENISSELEKTERRIERNQNRQELLADALALSGIASRSGRL